jgi:hypothetical protein
MQLVINNLPDMVIVAFSFSAVIAGNFQAHCALCTAGNRKQEFHVISVGGDRKRFTLHLATSMPVAVRQQPHNG